MLELIKKQPLTIKITQEYINELSRPHKSDYVFKYNVTISNSEESDVQILGKTLYFRDGRKVQTCVEYEDVNEEQAWVAAGDTYEYSEFHTMRTTTGNLRGTLLVRVIETDEIVEVEIPLTFFRMFKEEETVFLQKLAE
ncbi:ApaG domain-containing protein [Halobacteriovorax sp.]|uniref:ApaG domain-containing protein n=1 Tax=Halobacteriovorax sp. TaxID=2020862 RepID=UPI003569C4D2